MEKSKTADEINSIKLTENKWRSYGSRSDSIGGNKIKSRSSTMFKRSPKHKRKNSNASTTSSNASNFLNNATLPRNKPYQTEENLKAGFLCFQNFLIDQKELALKSLRKRDSDQICKGLLGVLSFILLLFLFLIYQKISDVSVTIHEFSKNNVNCNKNVKFNNPI